MRKRFVTVAFLGALAFASTNFIGCKDYDDDISKLQEQVDALKSISISDLASQLQSLKDANGNLAVANAKMEAAIAEIKTNIEALKEADKTLTSLVNGKVDQATYQAAIEALNVKCSDLSAKVTALSALETVVNDLKANKADKASVDALQAAVEALKAKDTELATKLAALQSTVDGLNTVLAGKADKATVDALKTSIDELKASVAGIDSKISKALEPIQAALTKLQDDLAKKADAATVAADIAKVKSEMTAITDALKAETAANLANVKAELSGRIAALETAKEQMNGQIEGLKSSIDGLKDRINRLENQPTTDLTEVKANIAANKTAIENALSTIGTIEGAITGINSRLDGIGTELGTVNSRISEAVETLSTTLTGKITSLSSEVSSLKSQYEQADRDLAARIATLEGIDHVNKGDFTALQGNYASLQTTIGDENSGLIKQLNDLDTKVGNLISEALAATGEGSIDAAIAKKISETLENSDVIKAAIETAISSLTARVDIVEKDLAAVLERIQSIVFVPQYKDANGNSIVPVYTIDNKNGIVEMTFRVSPAEAAEKLAKLGDTKPEIFSFFKEDKYESRATSESAIVATKVAAGANAGTIVITAQVSNNVGSNATYPVALKLENEGVGENTSGKPVNNVTTDYFDVRVKDITSSNYTQNFTQNILYTDTQEKPVNSFVVNVNYGTGNLELADCGFNQNLELYAIECGANWIKVASTLQADKDAIAAELTTKGFELVGKTAVKLASPININRVGNTLKVQLADNAIFGVSGTPSAPNKTFEVTYTISKNTVGATIDYKAITKAALQQPGSSTAFNVNAAGEFVWKDNSSNANQTFIIKAEKAANFTDNLIDGATAAEILDAIKNLPASSIEYKIGNATATAADPKFDFNVTTDLITVNLPINTVRKTYVMSTVYKTTTYGNIVLKATLKLAYPTAADLWDHQEVRWTNDANLTYFVEYDKPLAAAANYRISHGLTAGYTFKNSAVAYEYELVKTIDTNADGTPDAYPANVSVATNGVITFTGGYVELSDIKVKLSAKIVNHVAASEEFAIKMTYPLVDKIASKNLTYKKDDILLGNKLDISKNFISLKDRFGTEVIKDGKIETYGSSVYQIITGAASSDANQVIFAPASRVRYIVQNGKVEGTNPVQKLSAQEYFDIDADGKFFLKKGINLTKKVIIDVKVAVDYTYGTQYSDGFTITLEATE